MLSKNLVLTDGASWTVLAAFIIDDPKIVIAAPPSMPSKYGVDLIALESY